MLSIKLAINWLSSRMGSSWRNLWELVGVLKRPEPVGKPPRALPVRACLLLWNKHPFLVLDYKELIRAKAAVASSYLCKIQQLSWRLRSYFFRLWQSWADQMVQLSFSAIKASESARPGVVGATLEAVEPWLWPLTLYYRVQNLTNWPNSWFGLAHTLHKNL